MASYYDSYDPRSRPLRKDDSFTRPRDGVYVKSSSAARDSGQNGGERPKVQNAYASQHTRDTRYQDSRYQYPPTLAPDTGRPSRRQPSSTRKRYSWPPQPSCEDEAASLAKEAGTRNLLRGIGKDEVRSRGSIDQNPIIEDVQEFIGKDERRFVNQSKRSSRSSRSSGILTPPTSDDEKARKASRRPSKLNMNFDNLRSAIPEMNKKVSSPYAYSKPSRSSKGQTSPDQFLSPESIISPPLTDSRNRRRAMGNTRSLPASPNRDPSSHIGDDYFSLSATESVTDDTDEDVTSSITRARERKPHTHPPTRAESPYVSSRTHVVDFAPKPEAPPPRKLNFDSRRNTDTATTLPALTKLRVDNGRRATPLAASTALSDLHDSAIYSSPTTPVSANDFPLPRSRESSYVSSRAVSPAGSTSAQIESTAPPRKTQVRIGSRASSPGSAPGSVSGSRPSSPSPRTAGDSPRLSRTDLDWSTLMAANATRRPNTASRAPPAVRQETMPVMPRVDSRIPFEASRTSSLPYPMDDGPATPVAWMPSERSHQYFPEARPSLQPMLAQESKTMSRCASPAPNNNDFLPATGPTQPSRPSFPTRHSTTELPRTERYQQAPIRSEKPRANDPSRVTSFQSSSQAKKDLQVLAKKGLPSCSRKQPVAGYSDWYCLVGAPNLEFCPDCIDHMERTVFRLSFRRSPPVSLSAKVQCALGMPWIRLAWLMTLQQQRTDLNLLKDLAEIEATSEPCPGDRESVRSWFGLRDLDGLYVKNFKVCYNDVKKIERLLPTLSGLFVRLPNRASYDGAAMCAIRPEGNRFSDYLDSLIATHEKAFASRRAIDPLPFIELAQKRQRLPECTKDSLIFGQLWHYSPQLPEFTVCQDCFQQVIEPEVAKSKDLAMRFNRTVQPMYGEGPGSSCQLYSRRMRKVFQRALEDNDMRYLARKAKERRDAELRLQDKFRDVIKRAKRYSYDPYDASDEDERRKERDIKRITDEWRNEWE